MKSLLKTTSQVELNQIFLELEKSDEDEVKGKRNEGPEVPSKRVRSTTKSSKIKIDIKKRHKHLELEIEERKMDLKEREVALRKAEAEVEAIEFANERMKLDLEKSKT
ncbi:uncharacterized protein OCT59_021620 [Rhizophagus irregularis]|uniref:uncharacterized protein n=1 Tax=Rhizophagus irregularis TaxID=588596 RepID=UPI0019E2C45E|nr:hypothetical protein OCT59_021620 [Rhizophagus irregularis]GET56983.1 hypothetical protein GLOIN_2v1731451 [Rhizophagus irregularis DAOM 181602=DAOM 197198]CAG8571746.1 8858_t:CDS:2 [Rhizophagus irregularis]